MTVAIFFPMIESFLVYLAGKVNKKLRDALALFSCAVELVMVICLFVPLFMGDKGASVSLGSICGQTICFSLTGFRALYATVAAVLWFVTTLFSGQYFAHYHNRNRYYFFLLLTLGATEGVFFAGNFFTAFLFFEMMSFTSFVWVIHDEKKESVRAAETYLAVAVIGGLSMMAGIVLLCTEGELQGTKLWVAGVCILIGFGAKAGAFPLHIWLPKAHPVAPAPASALLSGILTKAGIFGILLLSATLFLENDMWGSLILYLGVATMVIGAVLALFSVDLKRTLACSSVSQIGFILVGIGMATLLGEENALAVRGSILHAVNHSLIKLVLFLAAGTVFMNVHELNLNKIRGFGRNKPLFHYMFLMGAFGIGGVPFFNGYISKTLLHESIVEYGNLQGVEWAFLISGGLTVAYMTKLYVAVFVEKNADEEVQKRFDEIRGGYMNAVNKLVLLLCATVLPVLGALPDLVTGKLADLGQDIWNVEHVEPVAWFSTENLKGAGISLAIGAAVYLLVVRGWMMKRENGTSRYVNRWHRWLDLENSFYRPLLLGALPFVCGVLCRVLDCFVDSIVVFLRKTVYRDSKLHTELEEGTPFTHLLGGCANAFRDFSNRTWRKNRRNETDYEHKFALIHREMSEDHALISRSLSFGLLLFCVGLLITLGYLLVA